MNRRNVIKGIAGLGVIGPFRRTTNRFAIVSDMPDDREMRVSGIDQHGKYVTEILNVGTKPVTTLHTYFMSDQSFWVFDGQSFSEV